MTHSSENPLYTVVTGIDGAGKSTSARLLADRLGKDRVLVKPGPSRPIYSVRYGAKQVHFQSVIGFIDRLHALADRTKNPELTGQINALNVIFNGRVAEPYLVKKYKPEIVLGARDFYADPAVYSLVYQSRLGEKPIDERVEFLRTIIGAPYRSVIFFLTVPPEQAIKRIDSRIEQEKQNPKMSDRDKWKHLHENPQTLAVLNDEYYRVLRTILNKSPTTLYEIDTSQTDQSRVVSFIQDRIVDHSRRPCPTSSQWIKPDIVH